MRDKDCKLASSHHESLTNKGHDGELVMMEYSTNRDDDDKKYSVKFIFFLLTQLKKHESKIRAVGSNSRASRCTHACHTCSVNVHETEQNNIKSDDLY